MISKYTSIFVLVLLCKVCFCARVIREDSSNGRNYTFFKQLNQRAERILKDLKASKTPVKKAFEADKIVRLVIDMSGDDPNNTMTADDSLSSEGDIDNFEKGFKEMFDKSGQAKYITLIANLESAKIEKQFADAVEGIFSFTMDTVFKTAAKYQNTTN